MTIEGFLKLRPMKKIRIYIDEYICLFWLCSWEGVGMFSITKKAQNLSMILPCFSGVWNNWNAIWVHLLSFDISLTCSTETGVLLNMLWGKFEALKSKHFYFLLRINLGSYSLQAEISDDSKSASCNNVITANDLSVITLQYLFLC